MAKQSKLDYQKRFQRQAHNSAINAVVLSPDGRRFVTGSDDSTVILWSTGSATELCHIKAHSPVASLAWLASSRVFMFACKNGMVAFVDVLERFVKTTYFIAHTAAVSCISTQFNDTFPITAAMDEVKIWGRKGQPEADQRPSQPEQVGGWVLKFTLPPPKVVDRRRKFEVTSVNWESKLAGEIASVALVSYKWHGIMCWNVTEGTLLWHLPMEECHTLSLSPDGRFAATFGSSKFFEVRELKSSTAVQSLQWQGPVTRPKKLAGPPSVCFAHGGWAVAGTAAGESKVHVWDKERGDRMLSLDHGDSFKVHTLTTMFVKDEDCFLIITCGERQGKFYIFVWATVEKTIVRSTPSEYEKHRIEPDFTQIFWINITFMVVLVVLVALYPGWRWMKYLYVG